jgi:hypothetical protein
VTLESLLAMRRAGADIFITYAAADVARWLIPVLLVSQHEWPDRNPITSEKDLAEQIYLRLMLTKRDKLWAFTSSEDAAADGGERNAPFAGIGPGIGGGRPVRPDGAFVKGMLTPKGPDRRRFRAFCPQRPDHPAIDPGRWGWPANSSRRRKPPPFTSASIRRCPRRSFSSRRRIICRGSPSLRSAVAQFYTNYLAQYRLPDRVQVNYVEFNGENFLAGRNRTGPRPIFNSMVNADIYSRYGTRLPGRQNARCRQGENSRGVDSQRALTDARQQANDFANAVFNLTRHSRKTSPRRKQKGLTVRLTAPFGQSLDRRNSPRRRLSPRPPSR